MIGPALPARVVAKRSTTPTENVRDDSKASQSIGPALPAGPQLPAREPLAEEDEDEDDYMPELPPDLAAARERPTPEASKRKVHGPSFPSGPAYDDDDDDEVGPMPLPGGFVVEEKDGVTEFLEKEEKRRKQVEEAAKPKTLKRDEWMLVPPSSSDLLGSIDPTKLTKGRQFARSAAPSRNVDTSLWTETPAERQARLADEVSGKRRRAVNADPDADEDMDSRKRRRHEEEIRRGVEEHTRNSRGGALLDQHATVSQKGKTDEEEGPPVLWDHSRDMALSGRLLDDKSRDKIINDARGLSDRFGSGKGGSFL